MSNQCVDRDVASSCTHGSQVVLKQLEDTSPEVQALAVKWCASAVRCEGQR